MVRRPPKIACCIVTYNRQQDLAEVLKTAELQSKKFDKIIVFDNAPGPESNKVMKKFPDVEYVRSNNEFGGSGGFAHLVKNYSTKYDYLYLIDDDVAFGRTTLEKLTESEEFKKGGFGYIGSLVLDYETKKIAPMNYPNLHPSVSRNIDNTGSGTLPVLTCSFVGMLLNSDVVKKVGIPIKEFFIYGDDYEYSLRISAHYPCYLCQDSQLLHKGKSINFEDTAEVGLWKHRYATRNLLYVYKMHRNLILYFVDRAVILLRAILKHRLKSWPYIKVIFVGMSEGFRFRPTGYR